MKGFHPLVDELHPSHTYLYSFFLMGIFKFHSCSRFQFYKIVLSTQDTMSFIRSTDFIHLEAENLCLFTNLLFPPTSDPGNTLLFLCSCESFYFFFNSTYKWHLVVLSSWLISVNIMPSDPTVLSQMTGYPSFSWLNNTLLCICLYVSKSLSHNDSLQPHELYIP